MPHDFGKGGKTIISYAYVFLVGFSQITDLKKKEERRKNAQKFKSSLHK